MKRIIVSLLLIGGIAMPLWAKEQEKFAVYYGDKETFLSFLPYSLLVFDSDAHPSLEPLIAHNKTVLGYISMGEAEKNRSYFNEIKKNGLLLEENPNWPGSYVIDIRSPLWQAQVIEKLMPRIVMQGFHGIFIDTLDTPLELERKNPIAYKGMQLAAVQLIQAIRLHYPDVKIMLNRAYPLFPKIAGTVDMIMGESIFTSYDFAKKSYGKVEPASYQEQVKMLQDAKRLNPDLIVYTLDYCDKDDQKTMAKIYDTQRQNGFIPYVATIELDRLVKEP